MNRDAEEFKNEVDALLKSLGKSFNGISIQCVRCGELAFAKSAAVAEMFGWSEVRHVTGAQYRGLCMDCVQKQSTPQQ